MPTPPPPGPTKPPVPEGQLPSFPGATGFGATTPGGRGGQVIYVTSLVDSGPGSLREALMATEPRMVLFKVSGTISLKSDIVISEPFVTIAGQTAPGEGIQIRGAQIKVATHDVIIRYIKIRSGDFANDSDAADRDAVTLNHEASQVTEVYNVVVDHTTLIWGSDVGGITFLNGAHDATVSYSIIGQGLYISNHPEANASEGGHSMSMNITELSSEHHPRRITVHHNLITTSSDRNPRVIGGENIDLVNNVIYNWRDSPAQGNPRSVNLINNIFIAGPMTTNILAQVAWLPKAEADGQLRGGTVYESGNLTEGFSIVRGNPQSVYVPARFEPFSMITVDSARRAYVEVLADAGANLQVSGAGGRLIRFRDRIDREIIRNLINRTGTFVNGVDYDGVKGFPAISWPELDGGTPANDNDNDGMADVWERRYFGGLERGSERNSKGDYDQDGYTDLEEYLNNTNPKNPD